MGELRWCLIVIVVAGVCAPQAAAQSASLSIAAETEQLTPDQIFAVEIRADVQNGDPEQLRLPDLSAFEVLGHEVSTPMQFSFRLGLRGAVRTMRSSVVHRFQLRAPPTSGRYTIGPARLRLGSKVYQSNIIAVTVAGVGSQPHASSSAQATHPPSASDLSAAEVDSQAFIRAVVDNSTPNVGEQVTVSFFLYLAGALRSSPVVIQEPSAEGFWVQDLLASTRAIEPTVQVINGQSYRAYLLRRLAAFPLAAGTLKLGSMRVTVPVGSVFDVFGGSRARDLDRSSKAITLRVKPLPSHGPPMDAPVHVGWLALTAKVDRGQVATGDAAKLQLIASGSGNLVGLSFALAPIEGLQILPPETHDDVRTQDGRVSGTRTTQWLIVPQRAGAFSIPSFMVHVWDPTQKTFSLVKSEPVRLDAVGKTISHTNLIVGTKDDDTPVWGPIRHRSQLRRQQTPIFNSVWYLAGLALPILFAAGVYARQASTLRGAARSLKKNFTSFDTLQRQIKHLDANLSRTSSDDFSREIARLLRAGLEAALGASIGNLTHADLGSMLEGSAIPPMIGQRCLALLEQADQARFGAASIPLNLMKSQLVEAKQLVEALEVTRP